MLEQTAKGDPGPALLESSGFLKSIFGVDERDGRLTGGEGTGQAISALSSFDWRSADSPSGFIVL